MNQSKLTILCIDDNQDSLELLAFIFKEQGFEVKTCRTIAEGLFEIKEADFCAIILDNRIGETNSLEACQKIRWSNPITPIIFYSGEARPAEIEKAIAAGADAYLVKPNDFSKLTETVTALIEKSQVCN